MNNNFYGAVPNPYMYGQPYPMPPPMNPPMNPHMNPYNNMYPPYPNQFAPYQGMPNANMSMPTGGQLSKKSGFKINNPETAPEMKSSYGGSWGKSKK